jgi:CubicO group peptidase (beta-lactamase class C family)/dienelactone hydrolase
VSAKRFHVLVFAITSLLALSIHTPPLNAEVVKDIEFANVDGHPLLLDLYLPEEENPPLVVFIHGGGWKGGSKAGCHVKWLTEHGYAVASVSYRLTDKAIFPAQVHDCKGAIRWLRANAEKYGYSVEHLAVSGTSAGGHLSALIGTSGGVQELEGTVGGNLEYSSRVDAVVDFYGATDFILRSKTQPHRANDEGSVVYLLLGGGADQKTDLARSASAVYHVTSDDPPFLVLHGDKDNTVLLDQSQRIAQVYAEAKLPLSLHVLEGAGHGGDDFFTGKSRDHVVEFLDQHLRVGDGVADVTAGLIRATPESQGVDSAKLLGFIDELDESVDQIHSVMVLRHGKVITEAWWKPEAADKPHILWSLSKSFTSTAVGLAINEGALGLEDRVIEFFPEDLPEVVSENLSRMTVRDLLMMSAGHTAEPWASGTEHWAKRFLAQPVDHQPGSKFLYNTPATYMLSAIIQKKTGLTVRDYLMPRLFEPLGIDEPQWDQSPQGFSLGGFGLYLKTEDIAKFGQLLLDEGVWNGKQLIPSEWIQEATKAQIDNDRGTGNPDWRQGYGYQFWRCRHNAYRGDGKDGQFCIVMPDQQMVVVMTAKTGNMQRQLDIVWEYLLPAIKDGELPANPISLRNLNDSISTLRAPYARLQRPQHVGAPHRFAHAPERRAFQGIPSLAVSPSGRLWANWYAGVNPGEDEHNYVVISTSGDNGKSWSEVLTIDPDGSGSIRAFDPELWVDPVGRLWVFWAQTIGHDGAGSGVWAIRTDDPDAANPSWTAPRRLADGVMMCKPTVLRSGEWVLPCSTWRTSDQSARMLVSTSLGRSWTVRGACNVPMADRAFDEHMITERKDGSLWLLARTRYGIGESVSVDGGKTWPDLAPSSIMHPSARFFIQRLQSGNLLLVKHGAISQKTGRSHLMAFVSDDDGHTWSSGLLLDERSGVSYPDGQQDADGVIHIIYDHSRTGDREILMASFDERDLVAGAATTDECRLRQQVSRISQ